MDQDTRNTLQRATQQIRNLLETEFAEQLEGTYDVLPDGTILPDAGAHLDAQDRLVRQKLVDAIAHIESGGKSAEEAVDEYTREAAFTFLNRFVALRMLEARGLLQECVSKGDQSGGFKEFCGLVPGISALPDDGYRLYLECLCDELTVEIKVLFDRRDPTTLLWPRRTAVAEVLEILAQQELETCWNEDETIGWVYQYFNSSEERKKMREESQAPRNSRELAVRNQFFTPRYVVQFLTDNTLGRIWYEMQEGETRLANECQYLVRRPSEVFLDEGQDPPEEDEDTETDLSQEELLNKTVHIPHRAKKDPRDLKILDPACGSGHFLLYAFDLLVTIYEEAWHDADRPDSEVTGNSLRDDYSELAELHTALPALVLRHNLHGIDIDPRCAQIGVLALWMRAQRAYGDQNIDRDQRPLITRSNIVVAEPMPGEESMLDEFIESELSGTPEKDLLGQLVRRVFDAMQLAGEAGSLLKIEEEIASDIAEAKKLWSAQPNEVQQSLFARDKPQAVQGELVFDVSGITEEDFWEHAEQSIYDSLRRYSEQSPDGAFHRRLFAQDAALGFAFIDLCRNRYDTVLMNPPFGEFTKVVKTAANRLYIDSKADILCAFVQRAVSVGSERGMVGSLTNRTPFFTAKTEAWRKRFLLGQDDSSLRLLADLGHGVLDAALVEAVAYVLQKQGMLRHIETFSVVNTSNKQASLEKLVHWGPDLCDARKLLNIPGYRIAYWIPDDAAEAFERLPTLLDGVENVDKGMSTTDDMRFVRLHFEVPQEGIGVTGWQPYAKGGAYRPFVSDIHLCVKWFDSGREMEALIVAKYPYLKGDAGWVLHPETHHSSVGLTFTKRTTSSFSLRSLPAGVRVSDLANLVYDESREKLSAVLVNASCAPFQYLLEATLPSIDSSAGGTAARHYEVGTLREVPVPSDLSFVPTEAVDVLWRAAAEDLRWDETTSLFEPELALGSLQDMLEARLRAKETRVLASLRSHATIELASFTAYGFSNATLGPIVDYLGPHPFALPHTDLSPLLGPEEAFTRSNDELSQLLLKAHGGKRRFIKQAWIADRRLELISYVCNLNPVDIVDWRRRVGFSDTDLRGDFARALVSWFVGAALGRWRMSDFWAPSKGAQSPFEHSVDMAPRESLQVGAAKVLVLDEGHEADLGGRIKSEFDVRPTAGLLEAIESELGGPLRTWLARRFFAYHLQGYSKSRRKAPIYWQLATPSASYSVWLYYHRFTKDTFFQVLNDYVKPKLDHERSKLDRLRGEAGIEPTRSQQKDIEDQEKFVTELTSMVEEVERIAPLWNPNLNDGVIINFAPLWRLVPQNKSWQKECKKCWDKLVKGDYDWAHLAMHLWPERVVPKCQDDRSLAIAHGLEDDFWHEDDDEKWEKRQPPEGGWEPVIKKLIDKRSRPGVKAALTSLLEAPAPAGGTRARRRRKSTAS